MNIYSYFHRSCSLFPNHTALFVDGQVYTYAELQKRSAIVSDLLRNCTNQFVGLLAHRSITAFAGVLGTLKSGKAYVPLNPKYPPERNAMIIKLSGIDTLIVDASHLNHLKNILEHCERKIKLISPFATNDQFENTELEKYEVVFNNHSSNIDHGFKQVDPSTYAYLLFTSGSTGKPKGVPVSHGNVDCYINNANRLNTFYPDDRFTNTFDLTFDLSVHDMFISWSNGSAMYCLPDDLLIAPSKFIKNNLITCWFSVPSVASGMNRLHLLKPGAFPTIRYAFFCGEPLKIELAKAFQEAAPNSIIKNIYGPTETTIGITEYVCRFNNSELSKSLNGFLSIGMVYNNNSCKVVDHNNNEVACGVKGELLLSGMQLTGKYWNDKEKTKEQFIRINNSPHLWYKTGDIVQADSDGDLFFCERKDFQVKIHGYRVELKEIDFVIASFLNNSDVVTLLDQSNDKNTLISFISIPDSYHLATDQILRKNLVSKLIQHCKLKLPSYMIPEEFVFINEFPLNQNGKIDRNSLLDGFKNNEFLQ